MSDNDSKIALITLNKLKWQGVGHSSIITNVIKIVKANVTFWSKLNHDNREQIQFATSIFNDCKQTVRSTFLPIENASFLNLASDPKMTPILTATLDAYETSIVRGSKDPQKAIDYLEIVEKYKEAKAIEAKQGPFTPQLTPGQERLIQRYESTSREPIEPHKPNQNAVTYSYLLGKMVFIAGIHTADKPKEIMLSILKFFEMHGDKTVASMMKVLVKYPTMMMDTIDIKPYVLKIVEHDEFVTATTDTVENRLLINNKLSMKRIHRMSFIYSDESITAWGLMTLAGKPLMKGLIELYEAENDANVPDKKSLAIVWYLCIGRKNMNCVVVDHHELSASNVLAKLLGKPEQSALDPPKYVFNFELGTKPRAVDK